MAISNRSYFPETNTGAASWILLSHNDSEFISIGSLCPGPPSSINAYHGELWGLLGITMTIWALESAFPEIISPSLLVGCDGEAALKASLFSYTPSLSTKVKHFDIISGILGYKKHIRSTLRRQWVTGHLLDHMAWQSLPRLNRINEEMDTEAKRITRKGSRIKDRYFNVVFCFRMGTLKLDGQRIITNAEKTLVQSKAALPLKHFWMDKCDIPSQYRPFINWTSFEKAVARLPHHRQTFFANWISQMTTFGSVARKRQFGFRHRCVQNTLPCRYML